MKRTGFSGVDVPCVICGKSPSDWDHIKTRGSGGTDDDFNKMPLCRAHHTEKHSYGVSKMAQKYPQYRKWLLHMLWEYDVTFCKWRRSNVEK